MFSNKTCFIHLFLISLFILFLSDFAFGFQVDYIRGRAKYLTEETEYYVHFKLNDKIKQNSDVVVSDNSFIELSYNKKDIITLDENSAIKYYQIEENDSKAKLMIFRGNGKIIARQLSYEIILNKNSKLILNKNSELYFKVYENNVILIGLSSGSGYYLSDIQEKPIALKFSESLRIENLTYKKIGFDYKDFSNHLYYNINLPLPDLKHMKIDLNNFPEIFIDINDEDLFFCEILEFNGENYNVINLSKKGNIYYTILINKDVKKYYLSVFNGKHRIVKELPQLNNNKILKRLYSSSFDKPEVILNPNKTFTNANTYECKFSSKNKLSKNLIKCEIGKWFNYYFVQQDYESKYYINKFPLAKLADFYYLKNENEFIKFLSLNLKQNFSTITKPSIIAPDFNLTNKKFIDVEGFAMPGAIVYLINKNSNKEKIYSVSTDINGFFKIPKVELTEGENNLSVYSKLGVSTSPQYDFFVYYDNIPPPEIKINNFADTFFYDPVIKIQGIAENAQKVILTLNDNTYTTDINSDNSFKFSSNLYLNEGENILKIYSSDKAGNTSIPVEKKLYLIMQSLKAPKLINIKDEYVFKRKTENPDVTIADLSSINMTNKKQININGKIYLNKIENINGLKGQTSAFAEVFLTINKQEYKTTADTYGNFEFNNIKISLTELEILFNKERVQLDTNYKFIYDWLLSEGDNKLNINIIQPRKKIILKLYSKKDNMVSKEIVYPVWFEERSLILKRSILCDSIQPILRNADAILNNSQVVIRANIYDFSPSSGIMNVYVNNVEMLKDDDEYIAFLPLQYSQNNVYQFYFKIMDKAGNITQVIRNLYLK